MHQHQSWETPQCCVGNVEAYDYWQDQPGEFCLWKYICPHDNTLHNWKPIKYGKAFHTPISNWKLRLACSTVKDQRFITSVSSTCCIMVYFAEQNRHTQRLRDKYITPSCSRHSATSPKSWYLGTHGRLHCKLPTGLTSTNGSCTLHFNQSWLPSTANSSRHPWVIHYQPNSK